MKHARILVLLALILPLSPALSANSETTNEPDTSNPQVLRQNLLRKIDQSSGRTRFSTSRFEGLTTDDLKHVAELSDWLADIRKQLKTQHEFKLLQQQMQKPLVGDHTLRLNCQLNSSGYATECRSQEYNYPNESAKTAALKNLARKIISKSGPFSRPPNVLPAKGGLLFEFYLTEERTLDVSVVPMLKVGIFPLSNSQ